MMNSEQIFKKIEILRDKMMRVALQKGFHDNETIALSQQLDQLLNEYEKMK